MERASIERHLADHFRLREGVVAVYLFGSQAAGRATPGSDVDVGVLYRESPRSTLLDLPFRDEAELAGKLERPVQIIVMNDAPADLVHRILRDGLLVLEKDPSARVRFEVRSRNEYFDLAPIRARYRRATA